MNIQRLDRKLTNLNGGTPLFRKWTLNEIKNELINVRDSNKASSFIVITGEFDNRIVGDALVGAGFTVTINPSSNSITIAW